ncbi:hypothetical protein MMC17_009771 [Xylographa soralifera]|nr:hypothetical protein [Xylographa soralifera]
MLRSPAYNSLMPMRSSHDAYRSLPGTPMGMDPRSMSGSEVHMAMNQVRTGMDAPDYFHHPGRTPYPQYNGGMTATTSYPGDFESDRTMAPHDLEMGSPELNHRINATNLAAQLANSQVSYSTKYGKLYRKVWPNSLRGLAADDFTAHICEDGRYPGDFNIPKTVETIRLLEGSSLDRIFQAYRLPVDIRPLGSGNPHMRDGISSARLRQAKVLALFEYLGAWKIVEHERLKRTGW